jgi:NAD(P)-dependent dehydrogenase (short-subunit alcohol dehydrogenase family)
MRGLTGQVIAVLAATGAIGRHVVSEIADSGARLYLSSRDPVELACLRDEIRSRGCDVTAYVVDATDEDQVASFLYSAATENERLDAVFNAIGVDPVAAGYGSRSIDLTFDQFMAPLRTIVGSQFITARAAAQMMIDVRSHGTILLLSSVFSRMKSPFMAGITAASAAIEGLTRSLAAEYGPAGIRVICLNAAGIAGTRTIEETIRLSAETMKVPVEQLSAGMQDGYLLGQGPTAQDVGKLAAFLVSDAGAILNGHTIVADRGSYSVM